MAKIFGFDLGIASIEWATIEMSNSCLAVNFI